MIDMQLKWLHDKVLPLDVDDELHMLAVLELRLLAADELAARCENQNISPMCRAALERYKDACK